MEAKSGRGTRKRRDSLDACGRCVFLPLTARRACFAETDLHPLALCSRWASFLRPSYGESNPSRIISPSELDPLTHASPSRRHWGGVPTDPATDAQHLFSLFAHLSHHSVTFGTSRGWNGVWGLCPPRGCNARFGRRRRWDGLPRRLEGRMGRGDRHVSNVSHYFVLFAHTDGLSADEQPSS